MWLLSDVHKNMVNIFWNEIQYDGRIWKNIGMSEENGGFSI